MPWAAKYRLASCHFFPSTSKGLGGRRCLRSALRFARDQVQVPSERHQMPVVEGRIWCELICPGGCARRSCQRIIKVGVLPSIPASPWSRRDGSTVESGSCSAPWLKEGAMDAGVRWQPPSPKFPASWMAVSLFRVDMAARCPFRMPSPRLDGGRGLAGWSLEVAQGGGVI